MEKVIEVLNRMQADGVFEKFAIGGGIAAIYYLEPYQTDDIDVFFLPVFFGESGLVTLEPIYSYLELSLRLRRKGFGESAPAAPKALPVSCCARAMKWSGQWRLQ